MPAALIFCPNSFRNTHHCWRPFIAINSVQIGLVLKVCLQKDRWMWCHVAPWSTVCVPSCATSATPSTLKPLNQVRKNFKHPWEDGSFSWGRVHGLWVCHKSSPTTELKQLRCFRVVLTQTNQAGDGREFDLNRQVSPLNKCDLGHDWSADCQLGRRQFYAELQFRHSFILSWSSVPWPVQDMSVHIAKRGQWCNSLAPSPAVLPQNPACSVTQDEGRVPWRAVKNVPRFSPALGWSATWCSGWARAQGVTFQVIYLPARLCSGSPPGW